MAHLLVARRQSMSRVVGDLERRGLVDPRYGATVLRDVDGLRAVMGIEPLP